MSAEEYSVRSIWHADIANQSVLSSAKTCLVPTLTFQCLFAFLVVGHGRRQLLWFAVTRQATAEWLAQQILEAFPWDTAPTYLVRDNDGTLRAGLHKANSGDGDSGPPDFTEIALAEPLC
jgi:hypothetical protein